MSRWRNVAHQRPRYCTVKHQMKRVAEQVTGSYLRADTQLLWQQPRRLTLATDAAVLTLPLNPLSHERNTGIQVQAS